jgi:hypothetical protein
MITATRSKRNKLRGSLSRSIGRQSLIIVVRLYSVQANASSCRSHEWIALSPWRFCLSNGQTGSNLGGLRIVGSKWRSHTGCGFNLSTMCFL